jgi:hypothetical protein
MTATLIFKQNVRLSIDCLASTQPQPSNTFSRLFYFKRAFLRKPSSIPVQTAKMPIHRTPPLRTRGADV